MIKLNPGEKIYLIKRRHRVVLMKEIFPQVLIFFLTIFGMVILFFISFPSWPEILVRYFPSLSNFNLKYILLFFLSIFLSILWIVIFLTFTNYYLDYWIITNQRTIHTELRSLFSRISSSVFHDKIQDITIDVHGILPTIFHFGNLHIQTAGEFREFVMRQISDPEIVKQVIFEAQRDYLKQLKKDELL